MSKDDVDELIAQQENKNTKKKTMYDPNIALKFLHEVRKEERELEKISPEELNVYLSEFIIAARTKKEEQYEPSSQRNFIKHWPLSYKVPIWEKAIHWSQIYQIERRIESKAKRTEKTGQGNKPNATTALSEEEIDILFEKKVLGTSSPQALLNTVWLNNILHFGLRGCTEQQNVRCGDVVLETDSQGRAYVHSERQTKSRQGNNSQNVRPVKLRMYKNKEI